MRPVGVFLGLIMMVVACAWYAWPLSVMQVAFVGVGVLLEALIIWAYFTSPSMKAERL